jgi:hypothetical protein
MAQRKGHVPAPAALVRHTPTPAQTTARPPAPPRPGLLGVLRLRSQAWLAEHATDSELRVLACRTALTEARSMLEQAQWNARRDAARAGREAEEEERELAFRREVEAAGPAAALLVIGRDSEVQRLLVERKRIRQERTAVPAGGNPAAGGDHPPSPPVIEPLVTSQQIERAALRAFAEFSQLLPERAEALWTRWRTEITRRLPAYAAREAIRRADQLRQLSSGRGR